MMPAHAAIWAWSGPAGVNFLVKEYPNHEIVISAQHRLEHFYINLGFIPRGEVYLEDNIDHIQMYLPSK